MNAAKLSKLVLILTRISNRTWYWCLGGTVTGCIIGLGAAYGALLPGTHALNAIIGWFSWVLIGVLIVLPVGESAEWKIFMVGIIYYAFIGGTSTYLIAEKKWRFLSVWAIIFLAIHILLSRYAAQSFFQALGQWSAL